LGGGLALRRLALLALLALVGCGGTRTVRLAGVAVDPPVRAPNFALEDQSGRTVTVAGQRGHWLVVTFLYTHCPDVCPLIAAELNRAIGTDAGRRARLHVIAVSVDPARDTLAAVRRYVAVRRLAPSFRFAIGSRAQLERVWRSYHVAARPGPRGTVTHSTFEILIDPQGRERAIYDASIKAPQLAGDLKQLAS
jgi:protein SCO1/2